ncbi:hypothetical protein GOODEAATRI_029717 [Goodea atripinnis]|uniref:Uncharacterized protein n=1 Tax=Goodea atripinnis TaxID=208336 RepID=A0ABV0MLT3_9TELE
MSSSMSVMVLGGSRAPSIVVLLNTPLILLPILLIPNDSPRLDMFLKNKEKRFSCVNLSDEQQMFSFLTSSLWQNIGVKTPSSRKRTCSYASNRQVIFCSFTTFLYGPAATGTDHSSTSS